MIAGLTGGIATGKSLVSNLLRQQGAHIIDADQIAHEVVQQGQPAWQEMVDQFGRRYLLPNGEINRQAIGDLVFNDPAQKQRLNAIVHPRVFETMQARIQAAENHPDPHPVIVLDVPLLLETGLQSAVAVVIVVYTPESVQLTRLMARDGSSQKEALARMRAQIPIEEKKKRADYVIDNSGTIDDTRRQAEALYARLKEIQTAV